MVEGDAGASMRCDNCRAHGDLAFTLAAYPEGGDDPVFVDFCSSDCLAEWTTEDRVAVDDWEWGVQEEREAAPEAAAD